MSPPSDVPILPAWFVLPLGIATLVLIAGHLTAMQRAEMPASRKRIRTANGMVMLFTTPLIAYAFGIATSSDAQTFVLVWAGVTVLVSVILLLAVVDVFNNVRLHRQRLRRLRGEALREAGFGGRVGGGYDSGDAERRR